MLLLAFDTSSAAVTVAVHDGSALLAERTVVDARRHAELLAAGIAGVLRGAGADRREVTAVVAGVGPGPFTGLRVGVVTARVLAATLDVPVHGICSLDALAYDAVATLGTGASEFLVATDARRHEVYWARYMLDPTPGRIRRVGGPGVARSSQLVRRGVPVAGRGAVLYPDDLGPAAEPFEPRAGALAQVAVAALAAGGSDVLLPPDPLYLRRPDAVEPGARKRVLR